MKKITDILTTDQINELSKFLQVESREDHMKLREKPLTAWKMEKMNEAYAKQLFSFYLEGILDETTQDQKD